VTGVQTCALPICSVTASALLDTTALEAHTLAIGAEFRRDFALDQHAYDAFGTYTDEEHQRASLGVFVNDEWKIADRWRVHAGLRIDDADDIDLQASPRAGLVWLPDERSAVKLLAGRAFRAPNAYERFYGDGVVMKPNPDLQPEQIETVELVWERVVADSWRASASLYHYRIHDMIVQTFDVADGAEVYENLDDVRANGLELECEKRFDSGARVRASWSLQEAKDTTLDAALANSPRELAKLLVDVPLAGDGLRLALEVRTTGSRITDDRDRAPGFAVVDATLFAKELADGVQFSVGVRNLFDTDVYDPVGPELAQDALLQDGRTVRVRLTISR
jgi:iron complex outermembrane receptor protein